jgi:hypothetical protein
MNAHRKTNLDPETGFCSKFNFGEQLGQVIRRAKDAALLDRVLE